MGAPAALQIILIPAIHSLPPPISASPCRPASACCLPFFATSICALHIASPRLPRCPLSSAPGGCPSLTATKGLCRLLRAPAFTCKEAAIHRAKLVGKPFFSYFHKCSCLWLLQPETSPLCIQTEPKAAPLGAAAGLCTPSASAGREEAELISGTFGAGQQPSTVLQLVLNAPAS